MPRIKEIDNFKVIPFSNNAQISVVNEGVTVFTNCNDRRRFFSKGKDGSDFYRKAMDYRMGWVKASDRNCGFENDQLISLLKLNTSLVNNINIVKTRNKDPRGFICRFHRRLKNEAQRTLSEKVFPFSAYEFNPNKTLQAAVDWKYDLLQEMGMNERKSP